MKQPDAWSRYAERILATGARLHFAPGPETLAVHACELAAARTRFGRAPEVLVLGATPELADLALGFGCRSRRVDCNPAMFAAAQKREQVRDRTGETYIEADWRPFDFRALCAPMVHEHLDMVRDAAALDFSRLPQPGFDDRAVLPLTFYEGTDAMLHFQARDQTLASLRTLFSDVVSAHADQPDGERYGVFRAQGRA